MQGGVTAAVQRARPQWEADGVDPDLIPALEEAVITVLTSVLAPDFDTYNQFMTQRGALLDDRVELLTRSLADDYDLFSGEEISSLSGATPTDYARFLWERADRRGVQWEAVSPDDTRAGSGLAAISGKGWLYSGYYAQSGLYVPPGGRLSRKRAEALMSQGQTAWICVRVRNNEGIDTHQRINFYYDGPIVGWIPVTTLVGNNREDRPFPLI